MRNPPDVLEVAWGAVVVWLVVVAGVLLHAYWTRRREDRERIRRIQEAYWQAEAAEPPPFVPRGEEGQAPLRPLGMR